MTTHRVEAAPRASTSRGERRTNATHRSTTDPEAKLYRKGDGVGAFLCHSGHAVTENRHGLVMSVRVDEAPPSSSHFARRLYGR
ncbi:MAG: hypothetical protein GIKADHBN_02340 [Phycisphaerales bacterium]|nr:hypothetical protein [Phycisphaerales bacterium]